MSNDSKNNNQKNNTTEENKAFMKKTSKLLGLQSFNSIDLKNSKYTNIFQKDYLKNLKRQKSIYSNPIEEKIDIISKELKLFRRKNKEIENNKLIYRTDDDLFMIDKMLKEDNLKCKKGEEIYFIDIICHILKKNNKRVQENEILKIFFLKIEKLVAMFKPLNISMNEMMGRLVEHIKYEKKLKDNILFKEGDKGDKFYIILKGEVGILIQKERIINCTPLEYLKYLIVVYLHQEKNMVYKMIINNRENLRFDDKCFFTLMNIFKFYHFYKDFSNIKKYYSDVIEFIRNEKRVCNYLHKKSEFHPEECFHILDLSNLLAEELYKFYCRIIDNIQSIFVTDIGNPNSNQNKIINNPTNLYEFAQYINSNEKNESKYTIKELFEKIYYINEASHKSIYSCNANNYIERADCEKILKLIRNDSKNFFVKLFEERINYKYYTYIEVNHLKDGNIFGELALINPSKKRTATVLIKEDCHLGVLNKESYDISIKTAQDKERIRNLLFFTNGPIFNGIANTFFLNNYFFRFKKRIYHSGEVLFSRGEIRTKIIFIINGELQLSGKMTLKKLTDIIIYLNEGRCKDDGGLCKNYSKENFQFKQIYEESKKIFRFYALKDKEIAGLNDMTENNKYIFDCTCISLHPTEVYELDFKIFEEAYLDYSVNKNTDEYVLRKKEILSNRLYKQRDSIAKNEFYRLKDSCLNVDIIRNDIENNKGIESNIKTFNNYFPLSNTTYHKNIFSFVEEYLPSKSIFNYTNISTSYDNNNSKFPPLNTTRILSACSKNNSKGIRTNTPNNIKIEKKEKNYFLTKNKISLNDLNQKQNGKNIILLQINEENNKNNKKEESIKILKSNRSDNISKIGAFGASNNDNSNKNNFSLPKKQKLTKIINPKIKKIKKFVTPSSKDLMTEYTKKYIEPIKIPSNSRRFIFNNMKLFEPLLNDNFRKGNKYIEMTLKNEKKSALKEENNKDNIKHIFKTNNINRNENNKSPNQKCGNISNKKIFTGLEENYKDIFLIDCLCLDKWEEKTNKNSRKKKAKLRGKKLIK